MSTDTTIIVCPDCGQRYDQSIVRGTFLSSRGGGKKTRVGAQDVRTPGHRAGPHHELMKWMTQHVLNERAPLATTECRWPPPLSDPPLLRAAKSCEAQLIEHDYGCSASGIHLLVWTVPPAELEGVAIECGGNAVAFARRVLVACEIVRHGAPWWHAWLQANGTPGEQIARGYRVSRARRLDPWLGLHSDKSAERTPTLRGLL